MDKCDLFNLLPVVHPLRTQTEEIHFNVETSFRQKAFEATLSCSKWHGLWDAFAWNKITFSDGTKTELHSNKYEFVRRPPGKRNDPRYTTKTVTFVGRVRV